MSDTPSTAADMIVKRIADRVPAWPTRSVAAAWVAVDPDDDYDRWVMVDPTEYVVIHRKGGCEPHPSALGPTVVGMSHDGIETRVSLRSCVDGSDIDRVISVMIAAGVIPDDDGMNH